MAEVMEAKPADDPTLQAMTICFREMQKRKRLPKIKAEKFCYVLACFIIFGIITEEGVNSKE